MYRDKVRRILQNLLLEIKQENDKLNRELSNYPKGSLYIRNKLGYLVFYININGVEKGIKKDMEVVYVYARKKYITRLIKINSIHCNALQLAIDILRREEARMICGRDSRTINRIMELDNMDKIILSKEEYLWKKSYTQNPYNEQALIYETNGGLKVRSKSERMIANALERFGVVFVYEPAFSIGSKTIYPDFIIRKRDGTIVIWEHFGIMNDSIYRRKSIEKIEEYRSRGFIQTKNLICTYEEDLLNEEFIDEIIERFIL